MDMEILQNPKTGNKLKFDDDKQNKLIDVITGEQFNINEYGILEFIDEKDITKSNAKSTKFYNSFAPFYEIGQKLWYSFFGGEKKARNDYLKYLDIQPSNNVLEVSVGTSANIKFLPKTAEYYGLDISIGQLMQSVKNKNKYNLSLELLWGNAENLPFTDNSFDVVFHIGGINLFNNKTNAINEMIRVAKSGTTILIADETEKVAKKYEKIPYFGRPFKNRDEEIRPPVDLLPDTVHDVKLAEIRNGTLYCLTFKKK